MNKNLEKLSHMQVKRLSERMRALILEENRRGSIFLRSEWCEVLNPIACDILGRPAPSDDDDREYFELLDAITDYIYRRVSRFIKNIPF